MAHRISRFAPGQTAKILGLLYAVMGAIFAPFFILVAVMSPEQVGFGVGFAIALPLLYGIMGAIMTAIGCLLYNLVAGWVGGIELEFDEGATGA